MRYGRETRLLLLVLVMLAGIIGCGSYGTTLIKIQRQEPLPATAVSGNVEAGLSRVDITPPPGFAVAGYSAMAETCTGFRNRLYARVIYIRSAEGEAVALVQTDLLSGSRLVHHRVAELIAPFVDVPISGLMFAGTHSHSAPGNFFDCNFYNKFASSKKGLDGELYQFLSSRIADAVIEAYRNRRPARIAVGTAEIQGVTRNRSMEAFLANFEEGAEHRTGEADRPSDRETAVNPIMTMIRVDLRDDDGTYRPAGAFSSFSVHPTSVPYWNEFYTADVFGYIARELEFSLEQREPTSWRKIHAAVNGTHGDNSPGYAPGRQGFMEARRVGLEIGRQAVALFDSLQTVPGDAIIVSSACREVDLYRDNTINGVSLCDRPVVGNALTAGAEDGKTPVLRWLPFFHEGWATSRWVFTGSCQGYKRHIGGIFQPLVLKKKDFPHHLFFQTIRVGDVILVPLPFEVTCQAGRRISRAVERAAGGDSGRAVVVSCANGYFGYVTTPEEYSRQHYEGGHTLYGPNTAAFLEQHAAALAVAMEKGGVRDVPEAWRFDLTTAAYFPERQACPGKREEVAMPAFIKAGDNAEPCWTYRWKDVSPGSIDYHQPLIRIETSRDGGDWRELVTDERPVNDEGYDVSVNFLKWADGRRMGVYEARWYNPRIPEGAACRFAVLPRPGQDVFYSSVFR